ncbi:uncharacterized protein METZ01_LOCUS404593, partial [marine metagenome]
METLPTDSAVGAREQQRPPVDPPGFPSAPRGPLAGALRQYLDIFVQNAVKEPAPARGPVPDDPYRRMVDIKGYSYFMNASQVGICRMEPNAWCRGAEPLTHEFAIVLLLEHGRIPEPENPARAWIEPAVEEAADCRIGGIAVCLAGHISQLGWSATAHVRAAGSVDAGRLSVLAGLNVRIEDQLYNPFIARGFSLAVVTTDYVLEVDQPLADKALRAKGVGYWLGRNGATSGRER